MIHLRIDDEDTNDKRKFACGIGPELPEGDQYFFAAERGSHYRVDCPGCRPFCEQLGTPISELSGRPGHRGYDKWCEITGTWGLSLILCALLVGCSSRKNPEPEKPQRQWMPRAETPYIIGEPPDSVANSYHTERMKKINAGQK